MENLIQRAREIVLKALEGKVKPVIYFSGGKDSVVMLHLLQFAFKLDCQVIFHREPWLTNKYAFGEKVIRDWGMTLYDYPPLGVSLWEGRGIVAFTNYYQIGTLAGGAPAALALPKNITEPSSSEPFVCGLNDILCRPTGTFVYPWDVAFIGHKNSDEDQIAGKVPLHADMVDNAAGPRLAFPLRDWTDKDIWDYTELNNLPVQTDRYNVLRGELSNKANNSDYFSVCIRCIDRRHGQPTVECPKLNRLVDNVSDEVPYREVHLDYFGEQNP